MSGFVFISFSRDDAEYVDRLAQDLRAQGVQVWYDPEAPSGLRWRSTIQSRIRDAAAVLLVESVHTEESSWVNEEVQYALRLGRPLLPLLLSGEPVFGRLELNYTSVVGAVLPGAQFVSHLRETIATVDAERAAAAGGSRLAAEVVPPEAWQFPPVPAGMVARPEQTDAVVAGLSASAGTVGVTTGVAGGITGRVTGVYGGGGFGKTVLTRMVCAREDVRTHFPGGLLWAEVGQARRGAALAALIGDLCVRLGAERPHVLDPAEAGRVLADLLATRPATLVVLDDVWGEDQLAPFLEVASDPARYLVTTRMANVLPEGATAVRLDRLTDGQARAVLLDGLPPMPEPTTARLLRLTGGWALAVKAANGQLRRAVRDGRGAVAAATWLADTLQAEGPEELDLGQERARGKTIAVTLTASLSVLDELERRRYLELAVFAENTDLDIGLVTLLWEQTGRLSLRTSRQLVAELHDQSLISDYSPEAGTLRMHDTIRAFLREQLGEDGRRETHRTLLGAAADHYELATVDNASVVRAWWELPASAQYLWRHIFGHLAGAELDEELRALAEDLRWSQAKLLRVGIAELDDDLARVTGPVAAALRRRLTQEAHLLSEVAPAHSHADIVAARLADDPDLTAAVVRFANAQPTGVTRMHVAWPLPDAPDADVRRVLTGHTNDVTAIEIAPDSSWLATASDDGTLRIWDPGTGTHRAITASHSETRWVPGVTGVAVGPDGTWLATASRDNAARIWDVATGALRASLVGHTDWVTDVAVAADGSWLATASRDGSVRTWDVATGSLRATLSGHTNGVTAMAISPDSSWIATASGGFDRPSGAFVTLERTTPSDHGTVRIWEAATGILRATLTGHANWVTGVVIAPDGSWLATTGRLEKTARIWDATNGTLRSTLGGHTGNVDRAAIAPDGSWLATAGADGTVRLWDASTGALRTTLVQGSEGAAYALAIAPDGSWLAATGWGEVQIWDVATGALRATLAGHTGAVDRLAIAPDGTWFATAARDHTTRVWTVPGAPRTVGRGGGSPGVFEMVVAPDGNWLATSGDDVEPRIWDLGTGKLRAVLAGHTESVNQLAIAPDSGWLATGSDDGTVRTWDAHTGALRATLDEHLDEVSALAIAPDGTWIASASYDATARTWDSKTGAPRAILTCHQRVRGVGHTSEVSGVAIAPDGTWLVTTCNEGTVRIWDVTTGTPRTTTAGHGRKAIAVYVAPDGTWFATASYDRTVRMWDASGALRATLDDHVSFVQTMAIGPDSTWLATGTGGEGPGTDGDPGTVRIWDAATGALRFAIVAHRGDVAALAPAANGRWLATAGRDGAVRIWDVATGSAVATMRVAGWLSAIGWSPTGRSLYAAGAFGLYRFDITGPSPHGN